VANFQKVQNKEWVVGLIFGFLFCTF